MALTATKFEPFVEALAEKVHNLGSDTLKVLLTNTAPLATYATKSQIVGELSTAAGYTAGGVTLSAGTSAQTSGTYKLVVGDGTWTASGGNIGPFRYMVLYNDTASNDELIAFWDYGSSITILDGSSFTVDVDATNGLLTIA